MGGNLRRGAGLRAVWIELRSYAGAALQAFVGTRAAMVGVVIAILPAGAYSLSLALQSNLAVELGLNDRKIALLALLSTLLSALGCVAGGYLSDRFGRKRMLAIYLVGTAIPVVALGWVMERHGWVMPVDPRLPDRPIPADAIIVAFWAANIVYAIFQGLMYGTRAALFMDICTPTVAATQFTAYMALLNLVIWYSATWQGFCIEAWGYPATLAIDAAAGLISLPLLPLMTGGRNA